MESFEVVHCADAESLARRVAALWLDHLAAIPKNKPYYVALSGGRIALRFFAELVQESGARHVDWKNLEFFWADERCVPPSDPESNFGGAQRALLGPLQIQGDRVHRVHGELDKDAAAARAELEMRQIVPSDQNNQPVLDWVFLGMGEDGHVASLFPNEPAEQMRSPLVYRGVIGTKPPPARVTLNYGTLAAARGVWVMVSGEGKEDAFRQSLTTDKTPLGRLLRLRSETRIFTDFGE